MQIRGQQLDPRLVEAHWNMDMNVISMIRYAIHALH
jgi:hypothetical protein